MFDPQTLLDAGSTVLGSALSSPAGPSNATGGQLGGAAFDNSGWNVNFGGGSIAASRAQTDPLQVYMPYVVAGIVGLVAIAWLKRKR